MSLPPAYRVLMNGKDMSKYVQSITNSFQLDETDAQSTVGLRADTAQENITMLREIFDACNKQFATKVYVRGLYSEREKLRMAGYATQLSGGNPFKGVTLIIKQLSANAELPANEDSEPYIDKTVRDIMLSIIDKYNMVPGQIDDFPQRLGVWYPGNRTFTEQLTVLSDYVGAFVNLRPPVARIKDGKIKIDGIFELPVPPEGGPKDAPPPALTPEQAKANENKLFYLRTPEDDPTSTIGNSDLSTTLDSRIEPGHIVPVPADVGGPIVYGPGKKQNANDLNGDNGLYYSPETGVKYSGQKTETQKKFEADQQKNVDPYVKNLIDKAKVTVYRDKETGEVIQAVTMIDNSGKEIVVPVKTAAASLKGRMVVDVIHSDESKGLLGDSGLILTMKEIDLQFPYVRVKDIIGFEYLPPVTPASSIQTAPGTDGTAGTSRKNYLTQEIQVKPTQTLGEIADQNPEVFKRVIYKDEVTGEATEYIIANDPEKIQVDEKGTIEPVDEKEIGTGFDENGQKIVPRKLRNIKETEFNSLSPLIIHELYQKRRAAIYQSNKDKFIETFYPGIGADLEKTDDFNSINKRIESALKWEEDNNIYIEKLGTDGSINSDFKYTDESGNLPPVFLPGDTVGSFLGTPRGSTEAVSLTLLGKDEGRRVDGKKPQFRASSIVFNPSTGADVRGIDPDQKGDYPFSMTVSIDNCVELIPGLILNCDETFGPLMGPYTIDSISESVTPGAGMSMSIQLKTQAYMTGYGRRLNEASGEGSAGDGRSDDKQDATNSGRNSGEALPSDSTRPMASGAGGKIANSAYNAQTADWAASLPERCSAYARASVERAFNLPSTRENGGALGGKIFGGSAVDTERLMRQNGLTESYVKGNIKAGTLVIIGHGSGGSGHIGISDGKGFVFENSTRYGGLGQVSDARYRTPLDTFVREGPTSIVQPEAIEQYIKEKNIR